MSNLSDKLHNVFSKMAKESQKSSSAQGSGVTDSSIANALGKAGSAFQLNQETEISSGFSKLYGNKPKDSFLDSLFDKIDVGSLADKLDVESMVDDIDLENLDVNGDTPSSEGQPAENSQNNPPQSNESQAQPQNSPQACQLSTSHQTAFDLLKTIANDYQTAVTALDNASNRTERRSATDDLWTWTRSHFPNTELMQSIAQSQALTTAQKQYELGRFAILVLRMEFLIGWSRLAGSNQSSVPTWERSAPDNLDEFYTSNNGMGGGDGDWCSRFAGYARKRLGFRDDLITGLMFNSGLRLYEWGVHDRTHDHKDWATRLGSNSATNTGVQVVQKSDFASLVTTLKSSQDKGSDVDTFFANASRFTPQAGDMMIMGKNGNAWKTGLHSHTITIEKYDAATRCAYTIEGNYGRRAMGRKFDFTDTTIVDEMLYLIRPGVEQHQGSNNFNCVLTQAQINELYQGMEAYLTTLADVATGKNYFLSNNNDDLVYTWFSGNAS